MSRTSGTRDSFGRNKISVVLCRFSRQKNAEETEVASDGNDDGDENDDEGDWEREDEESEEEEEEGNEEDEDEQ